MRRELIVRRYARYVLLTGAGLLRQRIVAATLLRRRSYDIGTRFSNKEAHLFLQNDASGFELLAMSEPCLAGVGTDKGRLEASSSYTWVTSTALLRLNLTAG